VVVVQRQAGKQGLIVLMMDRIAVSSPSAPARPGPAPPGRYCPSIARRVQMESTSGAEVATA